MDNLEKLKRIKRAEAPPFLFTRIQARIASLQRAEAPARWRWAFAATALVVLALNTAIILKTKTNTQATSMEQVVNGMHLSSPNDLYR